jgi:hypothetical protein
VRDGTKDGRGESPRGSHRNIGGIITDISEYIPTYEECQKSEQGYGVDWGEPRPGVQPQKDRNTKEEGGDSVVGGGE